MTLIFSGGGALRLEVECLEVELADLGPCWATDCCPEHAWNPAWHNPSPGVRQDFQTGLTRASGAGH